MSIQRTITLLQTATNLARSLDVAIGEATGWRKRVDTTKDPQTGIEKPTIVWLAPESDDVGKLPFFTTNLQHAFELAEKLAPSHAGGCSWEDGKGSAKINDGPYIQAINPQIALCIAALYSRLRKY